jgi:hypothetical protein
MPNPSFHFMMNSEYPLTAYWSTSISVVPMKIARQSLHPRCGLCALRTGAPLLRSSGGFIGTKPMEAINEILRFWVLVYVLPYWRGVCGALGNKMP